MVGWTPTGGCVACLGRKQRKKRSIVNSSLMMDAIKKNGATNLFQIRCMCFVRVVVWCSCAHVCGVTGLTCMGRRLSP